MTSAPRPLYCFLRSLFLVSVGVLALHCSHGDCKNVPQRPAAETVTSEAQGTLQPPSEGGVEKSDSASAPADAVQIFRATGELQCGGGKGTSLEDAQKKLTAKKIKVFQAHTQPDGLMHMALCGAPAGTIHVFSIGRKDLAVAQKLGFRVMKTP